MKIFFDTEFIDDGHTLTLLSGGFVREDEEQLYFETYHSRLLTESIPTPKTQWLHDNVVPHFNGVVSSYGTINKELLDFCGPNPEFWAYYCEYDWVILSQLFGTLIDRPTHWPMRCNDVMFLYNLFHLNPHLKPTDVVPQEIEHDALEDAIWTKNLYDYCINIKDHL